MQASMLTQLRSSAQVIPAIGRNMLSSQAPIEALLAQPIKFIRYEAALEPTHAFTAFLTTPVDKSSKDKESRTTSKGPECRTPSSIVGGDRSSEVPPSGKASSVGHGSGYGSVATSYTLNQPTQDSKQDSIVEPTPPVDASKDTGSKTPSKRKATGVASERSPRRTKLECNEEENKGAGSAGVNPQATVAENLHEDGNTSNAVSKGETAKAMAKDILKNSTSIHAPSETSNKQLSMIDKIDFPIPNSGTEITTSGEEPSKKRKAQDTKEDPKARRLKTFEHSEENVAPDTALKNGSASTSQDSGSRSIERATKESWSNLRIKGFYNPNMLCYRNSVLQLLASHEGLRERCLEHYAGRGKRKCMKPDKPCAVCVLGHVFDSHLYQTAMKFRSAQNERVKTMSQLKKVLPHPFSARDFGQQDAAEYFHAIVYKAEEILEKINLRDKRAKKEHLIHYTFGGTYCSIVTCPKCGNDSVVKQERVSLQLQPPTPASKKVPIDLSDCIGNFFAAESVEASCEKCKYKTGSPGQKKRFQKRNAVEKYPEFLVLDIMRYHNARMTGRFLTGDKLMNRLKFPEKLCLREKGKEVTYELISLVAHSGQSIKHGHYIAYVKQPDGTWAECNDEQVSQVDYNVVATCDGGAYQAAMLGYRRVHSESSKL